MKPSEYTFETYVTTPSNRFARIVAETICKSSEITYNPLYIYGSHCVGKTHLLLAMKKEYESRGVNAIYLPCDCFLEEMVEAVKNCTKAEFRAKYLQIDVLLLDRLDHISGKEATQAELSFILDQRDRKGKQTIFAGNSYPTQIPFFNEVLSAHLALGLCANISTPGVEETAEILSQKLKKHGIDWPMEVCRYTALNISSGVNQIEGEINKIIACRELYQNTP